MLPSAENIARKTRYITRSLPCNSPEGNIIQMSRCAFLCFLSCAACVASMFWNH